MPTTPTPEEIQEMTQPAYIGILGTVYPSGGPQLVPVWYEYDGEHFRITTPATTAKVRNIQHNPRVALCLVNTSQTRPAGPAITAIGNAQLIRNQSVIGVVRRRLATRYLGKEKGEAYLRSLPPTERVLIKIRPERFLNAL